MLPEGAIPLNPSGCAAGFFIEHKGVKIYFLPGVPSQMQKFLVEFVIPQLNKTISCAASLRQRVYKLFGLEEMEINVIIESLDLKGVEVGYYPNFPEVHISVTARGNDKIEVDKNFSTACSLIEKKFQRDVVAKDDETIEMTLGRLLMERGSRLTLAESCTGGLIAHRITMVPGSSKWFERGIVCYSNQSKVDHLGVSPETLSSSGAVSRSTAIEMAEGIIKASGAEFSLALTGIAGPTGGSLQKPVGTVYMAMSTPEKTVAGRFLFPGSRTMIQTLASETALDWLRRYLKYGSSEQKHFAWQ
jgi:nicotinamide-nucleotide amidase